MSDEREGDDIKLLRVDFRKLAVSCYRCSRPSRYIRVMQASDGEVYISTLCTTHIDDDIENVAAEPGVEKVEGRTTFINMKLYRAMEGTGAIASLQEAVEEVLEEEPEHPCVSCGQEDANTINGKDLCSKCAAEVN